MAFSPHYASRGGYRFTDGGLSDESQDRSIHVPFVTVRPAAAAFNVQRERASPAGGCDS